MIYAPVPALAPLDQGDLIDGCPLATVSALPTAPNETAVAFSERRVILITQTCDLANDKTAVGVVAEVRDAQVLVDEGLLKVADIKGPLRSGRIWGLYFLPADAPLGLPEMIVDFRRLHTVKLDVLRALSAANQRKARVQPLYREHLNKHFADTYSRIGLPRPYETL